MALHGANDFHGVAQLWNADATVTATVVGTIDSKCLQFKLPTEPPSLHKLIPSKLGARFYETSVCSSEPPTPPLARP